VSKFALVVGVREYADPEITGLPFAARDAEEVGACLREGCGFEEVRVITSDGVRPPDNVCVVDALRNLAPLVSARDMFLFYFAGHGIHVAGRSYLLTANSYMHMPELASLPLDVLEGCLARLECSERVLILDACRSDPVRRRGTQAVGLSAEFSRDVLAVARARPGDMMPVTCVLFSCSQGERAYEWPEKEHGTFTYYLLEGLRGNARSSEGRITVQAVARYVEQAVPRWASKMGLPRSQRPWCQQVGSLREVVLAEAPEHALTAAPPGGETKGEVLEAPGADKALALRLAQEQPVAKRRGASAVAQRELEVRADVEELTRTLLRGGSPADYMAKTYRSRLRIWLSAAEVGIGEGQLLLGLCHALGLGVRENETEAIRLYRAAADQGVAFAECCLGCCYDEGRGVTRDPADAAKWYRKAAQRGDAEGQFLLGDAYYYGEGLIEDKAQAAKWYHKAAEQGCVDAQRSLGCAYYSGTGVTQDRSKAVKWFLEAAQQGDVIGQHNLACCYQDGEGVVKDHAQAKEWFGRAACQGFEPAKKALAEME